MIRAVLTIIAAMLLPAAVLTAAPIHEACTNGDIQTVRTLLDSDPELLDAPDSLGGLPIHAASRHGHLEIVKLLLERGAEVDVPDREATTPLSLAGLGGQFEVAEYLIEQGADLRATDAAGSTPLLWSVQGGNLDLVKLLLEKGASLEERSRRGSGALHYACIGGQPAIVQYLLEKGMNINEPNAGGYTPLFFACLASRYDLIPFLVDHGADIDARGREGGTLLHMAAGRGDTVLAAILIELGLDVNSTTDYGVTPLGNACREQPAMVRWLLAHGANPDPADDSSPAPLIWTIYGGDTATIRIFLDGGANVNCREPNGATPLLVCARQGKSNIARILLEAGADPKMGGDRYGRSPLHLAALAGQSEMVRLLLSHDADPNAVDSLGNTPLNYAAQYGHRPVAELLIESGADTEGIPANYGPPPELAEAPPEGEAMVRYLGHSGWSVRTAKHLLIFDYHEMNGRPDRPSLLNGFVSPDEIKSLPVTVFSTHEHGDHYDTTIFTWRDRVENIEYVLGHRPADRTGYEYIEPRQTKTLGDMQVTTIKSTDAGVGYVVQVDGLTIFHAGDHSSGTIEIPEEYSAEIDFIAETLPAPDLAFMPISGCSLGTPESVKAGVYYAVDKLHPRVLFPQHMGNNEYALAEFEQEARERGVTTAMCCAGNRGDLFEVGPDIGI